MKVLWFVNVIYIVLKYADVCIVCKFLIADELHIKVSKLKCSYSATLAIMNGPLIHIAYVATLFLGIDTYVAMQ